MKKYNRVFIARTHLVDEASNEAVNGDITLINKLLEILSAPYQYQDNLKKFMSSPSQILKNVFKLIVEPR